MSFLFLLQSFINLCTKFAQQNDIFVQLVCEKMVIQLYMYAMYNFFLGKNLPRVCLFVYLYLSDK
jgi:hypothetical protein